MSKNKRVILFGLLLALSIIFSRFISIKTEILVISFNFIPIIIAAILLGPIDSMLIYVLSDLIGATLFPFGSYFAGFTIIYGLIGLIYGLFLYEKNHNFYEGKKFLIRIIISSILVTIIEIFLTGFVISILYNKAFLPIISSRAITKCIMLPIQVVTCFFLNKVIIKNAKKYLISEEQDD
ncbi:MAG: folate family ECF transporter S component [Clostridia bacterium]|nr:folate family ECF transporter S component [Clostridia bacterium]